MNGANYLEIVNESNCRELFKLAIDSDNPDLARWIYETHGIGPGLTSIEKLENIGIFLDAHMFEESTNDLTLMKWFHSTGRFVYNDFIGENTSLISVNLNYMFINACSKDNFDKVVWLYNLDVILLATLKNAISKACELNKIQNAQWLYSLGIVNKEHMKLCFCVSYKYPQMAKWLCSILCKEYSNYMFVSACYKGNAELLQTIKSFGVSQEAIDSGFINACCGGNFPVIIWLHQLGPKFDYPDALAFTSACRSGNVKLCAWLFIICSNVSASIIIQCTKDACMAGHLDLAKWLYNSKACDIIDIVHFCSNIEILKWLFSLDTRKHIVYDALFLDNCCDSNIEVLKLLYSLEHDFSSIQEQAIINSINDENYETIKWFQQLGWNMRVSNDKVFRTLCGSGKLDHAKEIYALGADIHAKQNRAFILACRNNHFDVVEWLLNLGVEVSVNDNQGVIVACAENNYDLVLKLYLRGADIHAQQYYAFIICCKRGHLLLAKWLYENGANIHAQNSQAFVYSCSKYFDVAKWLYDLGVDVRAQNDKAIAFTTNFTIINWLLELGLNIRAHNDNILKKLSWSRDSKIISHLCDVCPQMFVDNFFKIYVPLVYIGFSKSTDYIRMYVITRSVDIDECEDTLRIYGKVDALCLKLLYDNKLYSDLEMVLNLKLQIINRVVHVPLDELQNILHVMSNQKITGFKRKRTSGTN